MLNHRAAKSFLLVLCLGCGVGSRAVHSSSGPSRPAPSSAASIRDDSASVAALEQQIETAAVNRDAVFLDSVLASTMRFTHAGGTVQLRDELLREFRQPRRSDDARTLARDVDSLSVEMHQNTAVTTGIIHVGQCAGATYRGYAVRYVRVYRRSESGRWQLLSHRTMGATRPEPSAIGGAPPVNKRCC